MFTNRQEFIAREIIPALGEYAEDFDAEKICDAVAEYDPRAGYVFRDECRSDDDPAHEAFWEAVAAAQA